jgi:hypothetical protein
MISAILLLALAPQFGPSLIFDDNGDFINPPASGPSTRAPGDVIQTYLGGSILGNAGLARNGTTLAVTSTNDSASVIYLIDELTGASLGTIPVLGDNYFGLGFDDSRGYYLCTDASADVIDTYDTSGNLMGTFAAPLPHPVGATWDSSRDLYWIADWPSNTLTGMDPVTGATVMSIPVAAAGFRNISDCAYIASQDMLAVGVRGGFGGPAEILFFDITSGSQVGNLDPEGPSFNNPPGLCSSISGNLWQAEVDTDRIHEIDLGLGPNFLLIITGNVPGTVTVYVDGATPNGPVALVYGPAGSFTLTSGPCAGLTLDIGVPTLGQLASADPTGHVSTTANLPGGLSGLTLQAVDVTRCDTSTTDIF